MTSHNLSLSSPIPSSSYPTQIPEARSYSNEFSPISPVRVLLQELLVKGNIVVSSNPGLVCMWLSRQPLELGLKFIEWPVVGVVASVNKCVSCRKLRLSIVRIGNGNDANGATWFLNI
jgi:hypothetical protein